MRKFCLILMLLLSTAWAADPMRTPGKKASVLFFIAADCPNCNGYAPEFNALCAANKERSVAFYVIHEDEGLSAAEAHRHTLEYGYSCPVLLDPTHAVATRCHVTITPEVAVLDAGGQLVYHGRIDDRYIACGSSRTITTHDLRDALEAVLAGRPVATPVTPAAGCHI